MIPDIQVCRDYDGFFEGIVRQWCTFKKNMGKSFKHNKIVVNAIPLLPDAVQTIKRQDGSLELRFYSALRAGFGQLSQEEVETLIDLL